MNKKFQRQVLKLRPQWRVADGHFYRLPAEHILCGFVHESCNGGAYIWRYALPLYDRLEFLHLGFGERLPSPHGFVADEESVGDAAADFVRRIEPYEAATYALNDLEVFLSLAESLEYLENPWIRRGHVMTLIMLGRGGVAVEQLRILSAMEIDDIPQFRADVDEISSELSAGVERARRLLLEWEMQTKERFGVQT